MTGIRFYLNEIKRSGLFECLIWFIDILRDFSSLFQKKIRLGYGSKIRQSELEGHNYIGPKSAITGSRIGLFSYLAYNVRINNTEMGRFCSVGMNVIIGPGRHPTELISSHPFFFAKNHIANQYSSHQNSFKESQRIQIGHDVWIGANSIILDGVQIGHGAIIAAGSVVSKNVEPYSIVGGVPAKEIKKRFTADVCEKLLRQQWWNKSKSELASLKSVDPTC